MEDNGLIGFAFHKAVLRGGPPRSGYSPRVPCSGPDTAIFEALCDHGIDVRFVNESLDATPLREWLGPVAQEWSPLRGSELRVHGVRRERVPADGGLARPHPHSAVIAL